MAQTSGLSHSEIRAGEHIFSARFTQQHRYTGWRGILFFFLMPLLVACGSSGGNSGAPTFAKSYGGDFSDGVAAAIATSDGGYALVGKYGVDEDDHHSLPWFIKLDRNGDIQWHQTVNPEQPGASLGLAVDEPVFKPTSDGGFCMAGRVPGVAGDPGDIYVSRLDSQLNILWETRFDSGGWNGYEIVAAGNRGAFSYDVPVAVVESGNNSCIVAATSFAHLRDITGHGIRSDDSSVVIDGNGVFLNARSLVLASADVSGLRWLRRETRGLFNGENEETSLYEPDIIVSQGGDIALAYAFPQQRWIEDTLLYSTRLLVSTPDGATMYEHTITPEITAALKAYDNFTAEHFMNPMVAETNEGYIMSAVKISDYREEGTDGNLHRYYGLGVSTLLINFTPDTGNELQVAWQQEIPNRILKSGITSYCNGSNTQCFAAVFGNVYHPNVSYASPVGSACIHIHDLSNGDFVRELADAGIDSYLDIFPAGNDRVRALGQREADPGTPVTPATPESFTVYTYDLLQAQPQQSATVVNGDFSSTGSSLTADGLYITGFYGSRLLVGSEDGTELSSLEFAPYGPDRLSIAEFSSDLFGIISQEYFYGSNTRLIVVRQGAIEREVAFSIDGVEYYIIADTSRSEGGVALLLADSKSATGGKFIVVGLNREAQVDYVSQRLDAGIPYGFDRVKMRETPDGSFTVHLTDLPEDGVSALISFDSSGALRFAKTYSGTVGNELTDFDVTDDGGYIIAGVDTGSAGTFALLLKLDAAGEVELERRYRLRGLDAPVPHDAAYPLKVRSLAGGKGYVIARTTRNLLQTWLDDGVVRPYGEQNVTLMRLDENFTPQWLRVHGALYNERLDSLDLTDDGGFLIGASSDSLAQPNVDTGVLSDETWVLRLGPDGRISESCNAYLGEIDGSVVGVDTENAFGAEAVTAADVEFSLDSVLITASSITPGTINTPPVTTARQCAGQVSTDIPADGAQLQRLRIQQSGSIEGLVFSSPNGILCGNGSTFCEASFPAGSVVSVIVDDSDAPRFRGWGANVCRDIFFNPDRCVISMDFDYDLQVFFEPADGSTALLSVDVTGAGLVLSTLDDGITCRDNANTSDCTQAYPTGQRVYLAIAEDPGESFLGWGGDCAEWGTASDIVVAMDADRNCTALFSGMQQPLQYTMDVSFSLDGQPGSGGAIISTPAGIDCGQNSVCSAVFDEGTTVQLSTIPVGGSQFLKWSSTDTGSPCNGATTSHVQVVMDRNRDCRAEFITPGTPVFNLTAAVTLDGATPAPTGPFGGTVSSSPQGIVCGSQASDCNENYPDGTVVQLTAVADSGYQFDTWNGDCSGTAATTQIQVDADHQCTASFISLPPPLNPTLTMVVNNGGYVGGSPAGIDCGNGNTDCIASYPLNTTVTLFAATNLGNGSTFQGFGGDCASPNPLINIVMDGNKNCTANYQLPSGTFSLTINVVGSGTVTTEDGSISCPGDCVGDYVQNTFAHVIITSDPGNQVTWSGDCSDLGSSRDFTLTMDQDRSCTATFDF